MGHAIIYYFMIIHTKKAEFMIDIHINKKNVGDFITFARAVCYVW